ncbi:MAG: hypothetical protein H3C34_27585 [Caldilineaceae bacterium]|nr:hypothetical protein [Caldilineaceae bacterium]
MQTLPDTGLAYNACNGPDTVTQHKRRVLVIQALFAFQGTEPGDGFAHYSMWQG